MSNNAAQIKMILLHIAEYYGVELSETQVKMFASDLDSYKAEDVNRAFQLYRRNPKNYKMPLPSQLISILSPGLDPRTEAVEVARRLESAAARYDLYWDWPRGGRSTRYESSSGSHESFPEAVVAEVGEVGAEVIRRFGGWKRFYESYEATDRGQFHAQLREQIESTMSRISQGRMNYLPRISDFCRPSGNIASIGEILTSKNLLGEIDGKNN